MLDSRLFVGTLHKSTPRANEKPLKAEGSAPRVLVSLIVALSFDARIKLDDCRGHAEAVMERPNDEDATENLET
jgi:hypothetical protein